MSFVWFWTFWHWSKESFRDGSLLRSPLHGVGGHWDEWFRYEASENDRQMVESVGRTESSQRQFIAWLLVHWAREADMRQNRLARRFVLSQLAQVTPFNQWSAFEKYRLGRGVGGISAIVLAEESVGESEDIRMVEAVALPADATGSTIVSEGFQADSIDLDMPRSAAMSLLCGKGLLLFLALWIAGGRRPYPGWVKIVLSLGWFAATGLILYLLIGPDPAENLFLFSATLVALWIGLMTMGTTVGAWQCFQAWRAGRQWRTQLEKSQVRLRMNGGLTLRGGSAGLPFCLNMLHSIHRADSRSARGSWLWEQFFCKLRSGEKHWAATGVITADGYLKPVMLEAKLRACLRREGINHILIPRQRGAGRQIINRPAAAMIAARSEPALLAPRSGQMRLGFAAEEQSLRVHPCRHAAQALMRLGEFTSPFQVALNALAVVASVVMLLALPDLRGILLPPPAPVAVAPSSPSPYYLWISLDTKQPEYFQVALESRYWSNRRAEVVAHRGADASVRAEMRLHRVVTPTFTDEEDGIIWLERRHRFLTREFAPGERVGRYTVSYLNRLGYE